MCNLSKIESQLVLLVATWLPDELYGFIKRNHFADVIVGRGVHSGVNCQPQLVLHCLVLIHRGEMYFQGHFWLPRSRQIPGVTLEQVTFATCTMTAHRSGIQKLLGEVYWRSLAGASASIKRCLRWIPCTLVSILDFGAHIARLWPRSPLSTQQILFLKMLFGIPSRLTGDWFSNCAVLLWHQVRIYRILKLRFDWWLSVFQANNGSLPSLCSTGCYGSFRFHIKMDLLLRPINYLNYKS